MSKFWKKKEQTAGVAINDEPVMEVPEEQNRRRSSISSASSSDNSSVQPPQRARTKPTRINPQYNPPSDPSISSPMSPTSDILEEKHEFPSPITPKSPKSKGRRGTRGKGKSGDENRDSFQHPHHDVEANEPIFEVFPQKKQAGFIRRHAFLIGVCSVSVIAFLIIGVVVIHTLKPKKACQLNWGCQSTTGPSQ